jgi:hypothetical protein
MNQHDPYHTPFIVRYAVEVKESLVVFSVVLVYILFLASSSVRGFINKGVKPSVEGLTSVYGKVSSAIYRASGIDLGFVTRPTDKDFIFRVQVATYINERQAQPLIDIAMDQLKTKEQRETALRALLRFPSVSDWIRPFLNDIPKGGMVGLYDEESPALDEIIRQIRLEGGIKKPLVRAFAEVSLSFMLQVPDAVVRKKTLGWMSDILAEDAIFLIVPRIDREQDPDVRKKIQDALCAIARQESTVSR